LKATISQQKCAITEEGDSNYWREWGKKIYFCCIYYGLRQKDMYQIIRRSEINISKKLSKCPKCNTPYSPLMRIPDEKIFCKNCEDFQFILDKILIFSHLLAAEMEDKSNLIRLIETMTNPTEFFLSLLIY